MKLHTQTEYTPAGTPVVSVRGDIDLITCPELRQVLNGLLDPASQPDAGTAPIVLNLAEVPFLDSAGLGVLLDALRKARRQGRSLHLAQMSPFVRRNFEIARLLDRFGVHDSVPAALQAIEPDTCSLAHPQSDSSSMVYSKTAE